MAACVLGRGTCAQVWNASTCAAIAARQNVSATVLDLLAYRGYELHLYGRFDVGGGVHDDYTSGLWGKEFGNGFHGGRPSLGILARGANIPGLTKEDPLTTTDPETPKPYENDVAIAEKVVEFLWSRAKSSSSHEPASPRMAAGGSAAVGTNAAEGGGAPNATDEEGAAEGGGGGVRRRRLDPQQPPGGAPPPAAVRSPWFLWMGLFAPHPPYHTNAAYLRHVVTGKMAAAPQGARPVVVLGIPRVLAACLAPNRRRRRRHGQLARTDGCA